jgi:predicted RNA-binding protein with PUA-like domain
MRVLARGNRLSITPVEPQEWAFINAKLLRPEPPARVPRKA